MPVLDPHPFCSGCHLRPRSDWNVGDDTSLSCTESAQIIIALYFSGGSRDVIIFMAGNARAANLLSTQATFGWNTTSRLAVSRLAVDSAMSRVTAPSAWIVTPGFPSSTEIRFGILTDDVHAMSPPSWLTIHTAAASYRTVLVVRHLIKSQFCAVSDRFFTV